MKKSKNLLIIFFVFITSLIILPFFISVKTYLNEAERIASEKVGVPVTIATGRLQLLPSPRVVLNNISVGMHSDFKVEEVVVTPTLWSLFSATKVIDLKISRPVIKQSALEFTSVFSSERSGANTDSVQFNIRHISIDGLQLDFPDIKLLVFDVDIHLVNDNVLQSAYVMSEDGTWKLEISPNEDGHLILVHAQKWQPSTDIALLVEQAKLKMYLKTNRLEISSIDIALYGGQLAGSASLSWNNGWQTEGQFKVTNLSVKEPSSLMNNVIYLSGNLFGHAHFSGKSKSAGALINNIRTDFKFNINQGVLHGLDLVQVASLLVQKGEKGGQTKFDELSGMLVLTGKQYYFSDLKISSGSLTANGQVKVRPNKSLDGSVEVSIKQSVSLVAIPLNISGTVNDPIVMPSKAALAGAVAGTAILGPGVGTSLGVKAGGVVDKIKGLFQSE